jgi:hypothetical protein
LIAGNLNYFQPIFGKKHTGVFTMGLVVTVIGCASAICLLLFTINLNLVANNQALSIQMAETDRHNKVIETTLGHISEQVYAINEHELSLGTSKQ